MTTNRIEHDSMGDVPVPADRLWGAQTQRAMLNFAISHEHMPGALLTALALVKRAAASVNGQLGLLDAAKVQAIVPVSYTHLDVYKRQHQLRCPVGQHLVHVHVGLGA